VSASPPDVPDAERCPRCGAELRPHQDWCLSCGAAVTTRVARPPSWKVPAAIVLLVLALAGGGLAIAYAVLSGDGGSSGGRSGGAATAAASVAPPATVPAPAPAPAAAPPPAARARVARWPRGARAYTVVLEADPVRSTARARARALVRGGTPAGVLHSDDFKRQRPGFWVVFSGRYLALADARRAAAALQAVAPGAYVRLIAPR
jgi:hypothetical protein